MEINQQYQFKKLKIKSFKSLGKTTVYDMSMPIHHNFLLSNGAVAHNCFNMSHSFSYGVIAYACAYLKHYFPLEWWCGVLQNAKKDEIAEKFWSYCKDNVLLPDINHSGDNFNIVNNKIFAPISLLQDIIINSKALKLT